MLGVVEGNKVWRRGGWRLAHRSVRSSKRSHPFPQPFLLLILLCSCFLVDGRCPKDCSGHGVCDNAGRCSCFTDRSFSSRARPLWVGYDCSMRACPYGTAWGHPSSRTPFVRDPVYFQPVARENATSALRAFLAHSLLHPHSFDLEIKILSFDNATEEGQLSYRLVTEKRVGAPQVFDFSSGEGTTKDLAIRVDAIVGGAPSPTGLYVWMDRSLLRDDYADAPVSGDFYFVNVSTGLDAGGVFWDGGDLSTLHQRMECSGQGLCDRETGTCICAPGFAGVACQRLACHCSGHGHCRTQRQFASSAAQELGLSRIPPNSHWPEDLERSGLERPSYELAFDAEKTTGCYCDEGFFGPRCELRACPSDADPLGGPGSESGRDCSGRGLCDEDKGECRCFPGFTGSACHELSTFV